MIHFSVLAWLPKWPKNRNPEPPKAPWCKISHLDWRFSKTQKENELRSSRNYFGPFWPVRVPPSTGIWHKNSSKKRHDTRTHAWNDKTSAHIADCYRAAGSSVFASFKLTGSFWISDLISFLSKIILLKGWRILSYFLSNKGQQPFPIRPCSKNWVLLTGFSCQFPELQILVFKIFLTNYLNWQLQ